MTTTKKTFKIKDKLKGNAEYQEALKIVKKHYRKVKYIKPFGIAVFDGSKSDEDEYNEAHKIVMEFRKQAFIKMKTNNE